jgi:hypothetical protein
MTRIIAFSGSQKVIPEDRDRDQNPQNTSLSNITEIRARKMENGLSGMSI